MGEADDQGIWIPPGAKLSSPEPTPAPEAAAETAAEAPAAEPEVDYKDKYLRALAEMDNLRKRLTEQQRQAVQRANERFVLDLLPALEGVQRGLEAAGQGTSLEALQQGLELVQRQLSGFLESHGIEEIACQVGDEFDPAVHEAMLRLPATEAAPEGHIAQVVDRGFTLHGRVLRPARVAVAAPGLDVEAD